MNQPILVAGAGPAGLALALQAHAHGAVVRVVDRRPEAVRPSRALILHARTLEVLRPLGVTRALLPVSCLLRRADGAAVIWAGLAASAAGAGHRKIAAMLGRPVSTVRSWLARFASRAGLIRGVFTRWLCALDADPPPLPPSGSAAADAVAAVTAAAEAAGRRWAALAGSLSPDVLASSVSGGLLLSPSWAPEQVNTSWG